MDPRTLMVVKNVGLFCVGLFVVVGLDLLLGAKLTIGLGNFFNRKVDMDQLVMRWLTGLRQTGDREIRIDKTILETRLRVFFGLLLFVPATLLLMVIFRKG